MTNPILAYRTFVAKYLASDLGHDTPDSVARALLELDPEVCGFDRRPSLRRLHVFRVLVQDVHASSENTGLVTRPPSFLDESGAVPVGQWSGLPARGSKAG